MSEKVLFVEPAKMYPLDNSGEPTLPIRKNASVAGLLILGSLQEQGFETEFMDLSADGFHERTTSKNDILKVGLPDEAVLQRISDVYQE